MCEILLRVVDKINSDFYLNCMCSKAGDVIDVHEDGWNWGKEEKSAPFWRIIALPGIPASKALSLLAHELPTDPLNPSKTLQRRAFRLNHKAIAGLPALVARPAVQTALINFLKDGTRAAPILTIPTFAQNDFASLIVAKPPIQDPAIIGNQAHNVIG